jgi:hypothetical protein
MRLLGADLDGMADLGAVNPVRRRRQAWQVAFGGLTRDPNSFNISFNDQPPPNPTASSSTAAAARASHVARPVAAPPCVARSKRSGTAADSAPRMAVRTAALCIR